MEFLTVRLLGIPQIRYGERTLSFLTRKVAALLVYLVVERGMHSRESLMTLLWPESPANSAAASLRVTLSRLRQGLQPAGGALITEAGNVGFDSSYAIDLDIDWLAAVANPETAPDELNPILEIDQGEFLEGFTLPDTPEFDTWAAIQREACQRQVETVYDRLSQHLLATHNNAAAVETASRWVARATLSEQAYRRLMAAQALNGQRSAALQTYERLQAMLKQVLDLEPSRETAVLADNIGRGRLGEDRSRLSPGDGSGLTGAAGRHLILPLVGRSGEHGQLVAAFGQASQGGAQVVAVIGVAGAGKTHLVNAFQEWVRIDSPEAEIWQGRAFETGGRLAYQPVIEALRTRLELVNAPEDLLEDVWLAELSQLMPELRARYPDLPSPLTGDAHFVRTRLFEAVALLGSALAAGGTAVFVLDDMHWANADTLDLAHYLARRWAETGAPILLLLVIRQEAYAADAALREWLTSLGRDAPVTRLLLDSLNGTAVEMLVNRLAGENVSETTTDFAAWLWAETRGLPFFIEALLQMLVEQDSLPVTGEGQPVYDFTTAMEHVRSVAQVPLPPGVREVIQTRLGQQSKEAGALLLAAAVLGRACTFERLCQVADLSETAALEALETLLDGRLLSERPSERRPYLPAHDYIREVVYTESREARRRVFHRRALLTLEAAGGPAAECAFHALAALLDEPAFRFSVAAGSEAFASYAAQEALAHFNAAGEVAQRMQARGEDVNEDLLGRLYRQRGQVLELNQDDEAAQANYEEMQIEAVKRQSKTLELSALISQSNLHGHYTGVFNPLKSKELAQAALVLARELGDQGAEAGALQGLMVAELYSAGANKQVMAYGQQAQALARKMGLKGMVGRILTNLSWSFFAQNQIEDAIETLVEAKSIWQELGNLQQLAEASKTMLLIHDAIGDYRRVLAGGPELADLSASIGDRSNQGAAWLTLTFAHTRQGRFEQALDNLEKIGAYVKTLGQPNDRHAHQFARIKFYLTVGALEEAEHWADKLSAERETIPPNFIPVYLTEAALAMIARGRLEEGRVILDEMLAGLVPDAPWSYAIIPITVGYGQLHLTVGQPEMLFAAELEEPVRPFRKAGFIRLLADEYWLRGRAALALGQYDAAREALLKARETAEAQEERAVLWQILVSLADVEEACGDGDTAEKLRDEAREVVDYIVEHAGDLRDAFLGQPAVAQLLGKT